MLRLFMKLLNRGYISFVNIYLFTYLSINKNLREKKNTISKILQFSHNDLLQFTLLSNKKKSFIYVGHPIFLINLTRCKNTFAWNRIRKAANLLVPCIFRAFSDSYNCTVRLKSSEEESRRDDDRISPLKNALNNVAPLGEGQPSRFVVSKDVAVLSRSKTTLMG